MRFASLSVGVAWTLLAACGDDAASVGSVAQASWPTTLSGTFAARLIGDCIDVQEWLAFGAEGALSYTRRDEGPCYPSATAVSSGRWTLGPRQLVELRWTGESGAVLRRFTAALLTPMPALWSSWAEEPGPSGLSQAAYVATGDADAWRHEDVDELHDAETPANDHALHRVVTLAFDVPFAPAGAPAADIGCFVAVSVEASAASGTDPAAHASETFHPPCRVGPDPDAPGLLRLTLDTGADQSGQDLFARQQLWLNHPASVANAIVDGFPRRLWTLAADRRVLFGAAWLREERAAPPAP